MIHAFALFSMCLWFLVVYSLDVTDEAKTLSVKEGDSVTLHTNVNKTQKYLLIQWRFGNARIAEINTLAQTNSTFNAEERFRDRLNLDQSGSLTITNTRTTDSGLYQLSFVNKVTSYIKFNVTVCAAPHSSSTSERSSNYEVNNSIINHNEDTNVTDLYQLSSGCIQRCGFTEAVIRLVLSALVGVAAVAVLVYDIRSTRSELKRTEDNENLYQTIDVKSDIEYEQSISLTK